VADRLARLEAEFRELLFTFHLLYITQIDMRAGKLVETGARRQI
jgi:hypothetical protein